MLLGRGVEFAPDDPGLRSRTLRLGVDGDGLHLRQVDDQPALARRVPRNAVATPAHRDREVVPHAEPHRCSHVRGGSASGYERRPLVDGKVPDPARLLIAVVPGPQDCAGEPVERAVENCHGSDGRGPYRHRAIPEIGGCLPTAREVTIVLMAAATANRAVAAVQRACRTSTGPVGVERAVAAALSDCRAVRRLVRADAGPRIHPAHRRIP